MSTSCSARLQRATCILAVFLLALVVMPSASIGMVGGGPPFEEVDAAGFERSTYYRVTRFDMRLCPSLLCGGVFVKRVNRKLTRCADGTKAADCYVGSVDFSRLGLSSEEEVDLYGEFGGQRLLARGELVLESFGTGIDVPKLIVDDAWIGATGSQSEHGKYWGVVPSGIVCFAAPCPSLLRFKINGGRVGWLHSIDLSYSGASQSEIDLGLSQLYQGPGLIGFGRMKKISGPAGNGREFRTSEFYTKVEEGGPVQCGGFTDPPNPSCGPSEFCEAPANTCLIADLPGTCQPVGDVCPLVVAPVCGCDGVTYGNDCMRKQARVSLDYPGSCAP